MKIKIKDEVKNMLRLSYLVYMIKAAQFGIMGSTFMIIFQREMKDNLWVISIYSTLIPTAILIQNTIAKRYNRRLSSAILFNYIIYSIVLILEMLVWIIVAFDSSYIGIIGIIDFTFVVVVAGFTLVNSKLDRFIFNANKHLSNFKVIFDLEMSRVRISVALVAGVINILLMKFFDFETAMKIIISIFTILSLCDGFMLFKNYRNDKKLVEKYF